ncbi:GNAT family N-acetyltransferase [Pseudoclavibacter sp. VKM Ac-2867]|uniref:GNAT family N-acetyltransferase n=1 Tax=Pseudoclavibacter sp. VKM Ac-2867 TaxID=2783829 RepID=UPI00188C3A0D|nr:GNAT family N-acetyltransferase [Pseudoclavibacter sp. VKM Ac-2867]MBF4459417.1 GNAT family N-acetyltransferase [Pseudoclavibacter sp. VKM Ac-2867]
MDSQVTVRAPEREDQSAWTEMFDLYRESAGYAPSPEVSARVWSWITASETLQALVVEDHSGLIGFAHYRHFPRPIVGDEGLYLDDLFTRTRARGRGIARLLLTHLRGELSHGGFGILRWTTLPGNEPARHLYEQFGTVSPSVTYNALPER